MLLWQRGFEFIAFLPQKEVLLIGSPDGRLLSSTLTTDMIHPLAVSRWWFAVFGWTRRLQHSLIVLGFYFQEEDQCPAVTTSMMLSVNWSLLL